MNEGPVQVTMTAPLRHLQRVALAGERPVSSLQAWDLAILMFRAYHGTIDGDGQTLLGNSEEMRRMLAGKYGNFDLRCSRVVERDGRFASAVLVTHWHSRPFVLYAMTAPEFKRRGLMRAGLVNTMHDLQVAGEKTVSLVVRVANTPAYDLYRQLGLVSED